MILRSVSLSLSYSLTRDDDDDVLSLSSLSSHNKLFARVFNGELMSFESSQNVSPTMQERRLPNAFTRAIIRKRHA